MSRNMSYDTERRRNGFLRLKRWVAEEGISAYDLCKEAGVSPERWSYWDRSIHAPSSGALHRLEGVMQRWNREPHGAVTEQEQAPEIDISERIKNAIAKHDPPKGWHWRQVLELVDEGGEVRLRTGLQGEVL